MNVLKKLASPFVAIGRWIKETAWVQPLLIVGVIFAIIFSIPYITSGIQSLIDAANDEMNWFENYQLSLDGTYNKNSEANEFFADFVEAQNGNSTSNSEGWVSGTEEGKENAREIMSKYSNGQDRFFLFFVQDDCSACADLKEACEWLIDNWSTYISDVEETPVFQYQSIVCDEEVDEDEYEDTPAFEYLFGDQNFNLFAEAAIDIGQDNNYYRNADSSTQSTIVSNLEALVETDTSSSTLSSDFETPLVVLFDLTDENETDNIISTLFFALEGDDVYEQAEFVGQAWTYEEKFSSNYRR